MNTLKPYLKALAGFLSGAVTAYLANADGGVTQAEWLYILLAGLGTSGLVYAVPNKDPRALHQQESVQPPERGASDLVTVLVVALLVLFFIWLVFGLHR